MSFGLRERGIDDAIRSLDEWPGVQRETIDTWIRDVVIPDARRRCPRETGDLAGSIRAIAAEILDDSYQTAGLEATARHAAPVEARSPFLEPAVTENLDRLDAMMEAAWERNFA